MNQSEVRCPNCDVLFGIVVDDVLTVKYRDLYRHYQGGVMWGPCRGCGHVVRWESGKQK